MKKTERERERDGKIWKTRSRMKGKEDELKKEERGGEECGKGC